MEEENKKRYIQLVRDRKRQEIRTILLNIVDQYSEK